MFQSEVKKSRILLGKAGIIKDDEEEDEVRNGCCVMFLFLFYLFDYLTFIYFRKGLLFSQLILIDFVISGTKKACILIYVAQGNIKFRALARHFIIKIRVKLGTYLFLFCFVLATTTDQHKHQPT